MRAAFIVIGMMSVTCAAHADVYKTTDSQGHTYYTDKPDTLPAERLRMQSRRTDTEELSKRTAAERAQLEQSEQARQKTQKSPSDQKTSQTTAEDKAKRCIEARERYENYMKTRRLYTTAANGEREYLGDAEMEAERQKAKVLMDELCK